MGSVQRSFDAVYFSLNSYPDSEIVNYVEANQGQFMQTHLYRISMSNEKEASQVLESVRNGSLTFEEAAKTQSKDFYADRGGDMGHKMVFELATEIPNIQDREKLIALALGEYSQVMPVPEGWGFFWAASTPYPADLADSGTMDRIRSQIWSFERGRMEDWVIQQANEFIAQANREGFEAAVDAWELEKRSFGPLPINYGGSDLFNSLDQYGDYTISAGNDNSNFWRTAFFSPIGHPANPIVIGSMVIVLYPKEEVAADEHAIEDIKSRYASSLPGSQTEQRLRAFFLSSKKLDDQFENAYIRLYTGL